MNSLGQAKWNLWGSHASNAVRPGACGRRSGALEATKVETPAMTNMPAFAAAAARHRTAGPTSIRSMFRILATDMALTRNDRTWLAVARPVIDSARKGLDDAHASTWERSRFVESCALGLIAVSRTRLSWDTGSMLPDMAVMLADRFDASTGQPHSNDLLFVISGGARTKLFGTQLAGLVAEAMALLDMPVAVRMSEGSDTNLHEDSRWRLIWGTPTAIRTVDKKCPNLPAAPVNCSKPQMGNPT
jgi:hypothetical protein